MYTCSYCTIVFEKKDLTIDHIIPKSKGGKTSWDNVTTSCKSCNISKADKILEKLPEATVPTFRDLLKGQEVSIKDKIIKDWEECIVA